MHTSKILLNRMKRSEMGMKLTRDWASKTGDEMSSNHLIFGNKISSNIHNTNIL